MKIKVTMTATRIVEVDDPTQNIDDAAAEWEETVKSAPGDFADETDTDIQVDVDEVEEDEDEEDDDE